MSEDGLLVAIGSPENDKVYLYDVTPSIVPGYSLKQIITGTAGSEFGFSLDLANNNELIIGAPGFDTNKGRVYTYVPSGGTWVIQDTLDGPATQSQNATFSRGSRFGHDVAADSDGSHVFVGAPYHSSDALVDLQEGAVFVFNTGVYEDTLQPADVQQQDYFGWAVSANDNGDRFVASSIDDDFGFGLAAGSVYIFDNSGGWSETEKITASDAAAQDRFGWSLDIARGADVIAVGAYQDTNANGTNAGSVYIYEWSGAAWVETKILASDGAANNVFGFSVALNNCGNVLAATSLDADYQADTVSGKLYIFSDTGSWTEEYIFDQGNEDNYGFATAIAESSSYVCVGAPEIDGSVRVYNLKSNCYPISAVCGGLLSSSS